MTLHRDNGKEHRKLVASRKYLGVISYQRIMENKMQNWLLEGNKAIDWGHIGIMENGNCYYNRVYIGVMVWNKVFRV